jgi:transcriptional repressor NrdR
MRCPVCNFKSTKVVDSRLLSDGLGVRRRRECEREKCAFRFSTVEEIELLDVTVIKRNGRREPYTREKMAKGIRQSLIKLPHTETEIETLLHTIERDIQKLRGTEVTSAQIGDFVMKRLKEMNKVAYIRFACVYRAFEDVAAFQKELKKL